MNLVVRPNPEYPSATIEFNSKSYRAVVGKNGVTKDKKEGDLATPAGGPFKILRVYYRPDVIKGIDTVLPTQAIRKDYIWIDDPESKDYNQPAKLNAENRVISHEDLWRQDHIYNIVVDLDINRNPAIPGKGSAIFIHVARDEAMPANTPTTGCIALSQEDLLELLKNAEPDTFVTILLD